MRELSFRECNIHVMEPSYPWMYLELTGDDILILKLRAMRAVKFWIERWQRDFCFWLIAGHFKWEIKVKSAATKYKTSVKTAPSSSPSTVGEDRPNCIATAAYYKTEARGFKPCEELYDWREAETKFDACEGH